MTEITALEALRGYTAQVNHANQNASKARYEAIQDLERAYDFWSRGTAPSVAEKNALVSRFSSLEDEIAKLNAGLDQHIGSALELAKLREENRQLAAQLAEAADFRAKLKSYLSD